MTKATHMLKLADNFFVYGLIDPRNGALRYVGSSTRGMDRPRDHWKRKQDRERHDHCHAWVRSLLREGLVPVVEVLETTRHLNEAEPFWIAYFRMIGADLTNMTDGGEGAQQTAEVRAKISKTMTGRPSPLKGRKGPKRDPEVYRKIWETRYKNMVDVVHMSRSEGKCRCLGSKIETGSRTRS